MPDILVSCEGLLYAYIYVYVCTKEQMYNQSYLRARKCPLTVIILPFTPVEEKKRRFEASKETAR